jgi:RNA recognition motif-containing protein
MKLLIRNLARITKEAEVRALFEAYGSVQSCSLVMDKKSGQSKGFGFIEMPKPGEAKAAIKNLNGKEVHESKIRVKKAEEKSDEVVEEDQTPKADVKTKPSTDKKKTKPAFQGYKKVKKSD